MAAGAARGARCDPEMANDPIATIYLADRTDGSAIYQANMNLLYVITTYGALVFAAIGTDIIKNPWALAFIGAPLWGLLCYQVQLLALVSVRVNSIRILERTLLEAAQGLDPQEKNQIGSDAGDRISRVSSQPIGLRAANLAAFFAIGLASVVVAIASLLSVPHCTWAFTLGVVTHIVLGLTFFLGLCSLARIKTLISELCRDGPYKQDQHDQHDATGRQSNG